MINIYLKFEKYRRVSEYRHIGGKINSRTVYRVVRASKQEVKGEFDTINREMGCRKCSLEALK